MRRTGLLQLLAIAVITVSVFLVSPTPAHASFLDWFFGYSSASKNVEEGNQAVIDGEAGKANFRHFTDSGLLNIQSSSLTYMAGPSENAMTSMTPEERQLLVDRYGKGGALGAVTEGITALYTPPASAQTYVADLLHSAHIIPQAQAQGLGFAALDPVLQVWKMFRNLAYLIFVILFIVIGFMIMFRQKIGQTAVTVQQAIPNIIVSLIFVTFSYAIAGLAIDLMYLVMYLLVGMFSGAQAQDIMQYSFFDLGWSVLTGQNGSGEAAFTAVFDNIDSVVKAAINMDGIGDAIGWVSGITASVIMAVAVLIGVFKLFFELLKTYITIVLSIAFAPLILMMGALPGRNAFKTWIVNLVGNLLAFPTVLMIVIVYRMFSSVDIDTGGFLPPFLIGRGVGGTITTLVGVGVVLIMPELVVEMKKAVGVTGSIFEQLGKAMVTNFKGGIKPAGTAATIGATVGGAGLGAGVGALVGGARGFAGEGTLSERFARAGRGASSGARTGAMIGGVTPMAARALPGLVRGGVRTIGSQIQDIATEETVKKAIDRYKQGPLKARQGQQENVLSAQDKARSSTQPTTRDVIGGDVDTSNGTFG